MVPAQGEHYINVLGDKWASTEGKSNWVLSSFQTSPQIECLVLSVGLLLVWGVVYLFFDHIVPSHLIGCLMNK